MAQAHTFPNEGMYLARCRLVKLLRRDLRVKFCCEGKIGTRIAISYAGFMQRMKTYKDVQKFTMRKRKELIRNRALGKKVKTFTVAEVLNIKDQPWDVSKVEILDYEIDPDN